MGELSGAITSTGKVFMFPTVKLATRAIKVIIRLGRQCFGNIGCGRVKTVDDTYTFYEVQVSWTDNLESDHADEMNV